MIAQNRRARFDYTILETLEAGIILLGSEIKAIRQGKVNIKDAFASVENGELFLTNSHVGHYAESHQFNHEERRPRKLLVRRRELLRLRGAIQKKGNTVVPLKMYYTRKGIVKVELGLAKGKTNIDRRATIKEREWQREKSRVLKDH